MSQMPFLDNASEGKNNWWRYLFTIILSLILTSVAVGFLVYIFLLVLIFIAQVGNVGVYRIDQIVRDPMFILFLVAISSAASFIVFYLCARFIHHRRFISLITTKSKIKYTRILKGAGIWLAIIASLDILLFLIYPESYKVTFDPNKYGLLLILSLFALPIQASFEEIVFRGYLMQGIGLLSKKPVIPLIATSIIFGVVHWWNGNSEIMCISTVLATFIIGIMLGVITLGENNIETAVGVHIMNNMYIALVNNPSDSPLGNLPSIVTSQQDPYILMLLTFIASLIMIAIVFRKKRGDLFGILVNDALYN